MDWRQLDIEFQVSEDPGLGTLDPRFVEIAGMIQESNFSAAARQAQEVIEEEIYDIRIISYFLYGVFDEQGPGSLYGILKVLSNVLTQNWDAVGPLKNREKQVKNSLTWFFKQTNKVLETQEKKEGPEWGKWLSETASDDIYEAIEMGNDFKANAGRTLEDHASAIIDQVARTLAWLDSFYRLIYQEEPDASEEEEADFDSEEDADDPESPDAFEEDTRPYTNEQSAAGGSWPGVGQADNTGGGSYLLQQLIRKMALFERLLAENKNTGAALVADDINNILADFDPQVYFPEIFSGFAMQYALNVEKILPFQGCQNSPVWQAADNLYRVDMERFAAMNNGFHNQEPDAFARSDSYAQEDAGNPTSYNQDNYNQDQNGYDVEEDYYGEDEDDDF